ncbi:hypothetical protein BDV98DRAFT_569995 [Pterulicium gracile]|uniref:Uncharacterized protein n=1 Tax=Pterulicium gracile TaxID=1884261 RepID=A0A5C3QDF8_9AGAR|nr:hypothetical protein BDV98DRAFT_569995 [Pterula gracilis]
MLLLTITRRLRPRCVMSKGTNGRQLTHALLCFAFHVFFILALCYVHIPHNLRPMNGWHTYASLLLWQPRTSHPPRTHHE